jgi:hypothetical protein
MKRKRWSVCIDCRQGDCDSCCEHTCDCNMKFAHRPPRKAQTSLKTRQATKRPAREAGAKQEKWQWRLTVQR